MLINLLLQEGIDDPQNNQSPKVCPEEEREDDEPDSLITVADSCEANTDPIPVRKLFVNPESVFAPPVPVDLAILLIIVYVTFSVLPTGIVTSSITSLAMRSLSP